MKKKREGYSESISAHTVITTTDNRGHYVYRECMRNESTVCMSHACVCTSWFVDVICVACDVYTPMCIDDDLGPQVLLKFKRDGKVYYKTTTKRGKR